MKLTLTYEDDQGRIATFESVVGSIEVTNDLRVEFVDGSSISVPDDQTVHATLYRCQAFTTLPVKETTKCP